MDAKWFIELAKNSTSAEYRSANALVAIAILLERIWGER